MGLGVIIENVRSMNWLLKEANVVNNAVVGLDSVVDLFLKYLDIAHSGVAPYIDSAFGGQQSQAVRRLEFSYFRRDCL